jgi:HrpA-like RNA helicase
VSLSSPAKLFDAIRFFSVLQEMRKAKAPPVPTQMATESSVPQQQQRQVQPVERVVLPIDEHEKKILDEIKNNRVTIIHGQTGCGKSSRLPCMLLRAPPPDPMFKEVKFFISQPRRIAAKALVERIRSCEPELRDSIALRMGHGVVEYECKMTKAWFVTTGYLVRVLANQPDKFKAHTHLIIDEVHERSVDTDILCLLCRRLLQSNSSIRLILMSATLAAELYQQYFNVVRPVIFVGARRFPIEQVYVEDLRARYKLKPKELKAAQAIADDCERLKCKGPPSQGHMENMFRLAAHLTMVVGRPGSSVLIFVPGMNEIVAITDLVEKLYLPGVRFTCIPIHSDIPFEDQMTAFDTPEPDEVKVIIATNAAESSVTLPDVDQVICLGLCKQIEYNESSHRQILLPVWISKASATQRAGRTGRLRPGVVYRLYTRNTYENYMGEFEPGEMVRIPLDSVILSLKEMLKEEATPVLLDCLEPPDISTIERSFQSLYDSNFISEPDDQGDITVLGSFVNALGVDLTLGSLIGYGIQMGVGPEAIEMAAVLSFPKQPWVMTNPLIHDAPEYNGKLLRLLRTKHSLRMPF